ncbi:hypothetical protein ACD578_15920 [Microvirga sp. RSM25]|uniref:hypothetical protein n=1 Tax=Microvirga sp. RSM25 TaxID=3273802 RepID=UPI00384B17D3
MRHTASLSRRSILSGSLAALVASPALASGARLTSDDNALLALGREWWAAWGRVAELDGRVEEAESHFWSIHPQMPQELTVQPHDFALDMPRGENHWRQSADASQQIYNQAAIARLRAKACTRQDWSRVVGDSETGVLPGQKPFPEAQARADEIVSAWDAYQASIADARERSGLTAAEQALTENNGSLHNLEERIATTRATTREGKLLKARMAAAASFADGGLQGELEQCLEDRYSAGLPLGLSLILDILHENGGDA